MKDTTPLRATTAPREAPLAHRPRKNGRAREDALGYVLLLPTFSVLVVLIFLPLLMVFRDSLQNKTFLSSAYRFVGCDNYRALLTSAPFWAIVLRSLVWTVSSVALQVAAGMIMALFVNQSFRGRAIVRGLFLLPWVIPVVVVTVIWKWLLNDLYGLASFILEWIYPPWAHLPWFSDPVLALPTLIAINVWRGAPFAMVMLLAGLQTVPRELLEAARIDGANRFQQFLHVTIPHLRRILLILVLVFGLFNFNNFDLIFLTTQGGPLDRTMTLPVKTYEIAFKGLQVGTSSALAVMMLALLAIFSSVYLNLAGIKRYGRT